MTISKSSLGAIKEKFHILLSEKEWELVLRWRAETFNLIRGQLPENERQASLLKVIEEKKPPSSTFEIAWLKVAKISKMLETEINLRERISQLHQISRDWGPALQKMRSDNQSQVDELNVNFAKKSAKLSTEVAGLGEKLSQSRAECSRHIQRSKSLQAELQRSWIAIYESGVDHEPSPEFASLQAATIHESIFKRKSKINLRDINTVLSAGKSNISNANLATLLEGARALNVPSEQMKEIEEECKARGIPTDLPANETLPNDLLWTCQACGRSTIFCQCG